MPGPDRSLDLFAVLAEGLPQDEKERVIDLVRRNNAHERLAAQGSPDGAASGGGRPPSARQRVAQPRHSRRAAPPSDYQPVLIDRDR